MQSEHNHNVVIIVIAKFSPQHSRACDQYLFVSGAKKESTSSTYIELCIKSIRQFNKTKETEHNVKSRVHQASQLGDKCAVRNRCLTKTNQKTAPEVLEYKTA